MSLRDVFADRTDGAAAGLALGHQAAGARLLWVQDRLSRREGGRPHPAGMAALLGGPLVLLHLDVPRPADVLWAMEQALGCRGLSAVVGEIWGEPAVLDLTATRRLALRAERSGVQAWLLRHAATPSLSAARERWRLAAMPSAPSPDDPHAPGEALWRAELFRSRDRAAGMWLARCDPTKGLVLLRDAGEVGRPAPARPGPPVLRRA
ncbi:hypothetical protein [Rubellimicrobium sp. CFH 75288]|uniref:hypothetical protein n=1 Tax=Rubellimicrobium sp. CFH 75288 TaxID=2697034 RepID=UPI0014135F53|nr:hypothetical protein [Rubellimicrobium sp. CFH 75288]NAZ38363.1 hypothetical protein [Rubellimicrobium sp. CFH 75288]